VLETRQETERAPCSRLPVIGLYSKPHELMIKHFSESSSLRPKRRVPRCIALSGRVTCREDAVGQSVASTGSTGMAVGYAVIIPGIPAPLPFPFGACTQHVNTTAWIKMSSNASNYLCFTSNMGNARFLIATRMCTFSQMQAPLPFAEVLGSNINAEWCLLLQ
jgi:hypothetical protein